MIKYIDSESVTNEMLKVYQKTKDKKEVIIFITQVFPELMGKYNELLKKIKENVKKREEVFTQIDTHMIEFNKEKVQQDNDATERSIVV